MSVSIDVLENNWCVKQPAWTDLRCNDSPDIQAEDGSARGSYTVGKINGVYQS